MSKTIFNFLFGSIDLTLRLIFEMISKWLQLLLLSKVKEICILRIFHVSFILMVLPNIGLSDVTGMVSDTVFRNTVNDRRIVTPGIYRLCYFSNFWESFLWDLYFHILHIYQLAILVTKIIYLDGRNNRCINVSQTFEPRNGMKRG